MKRSYLVLLSALAFCFFISCKKDNKTTQNTLTGNWKFVSISAKTESDNQYTSGGVVYKTVTLSQYTSTQNGGTATITPDVMAGSGITYTIGTTAWAYNYQDGVLIDSISSPFNFTVPPTSTSAGYKLIGQDSISYTGAALFGAPSGGSLASGTKYTLAGNTLTMTSSVVKDTTMNYGFPVSVHETATAVSVLQRQ